MMFAGKYRLSEIVKKMFDLLMIGYKWQVFGKSNIWRTNDEVLLKDWKEIGDKKELVQ